jgi:hypothetical protein
VIRGGKLVNIPQDTAYAYVDVLDVVARMEAEWTFEPGISGATVAIITGKDSSALLSNDVHVICTAESCSIQLYRLGETPLIPPLKQVYFSAPLACDSKTVHKLTYEIVGNTVTVALSNGVKFSATDPRVSECTGKRAIWEIHSMAAGRAEPRFCSVAAYSRNTTRPPSAFTTPLDLVAMISAVNPIQTHSTRFTPSQTGWYRIAQGNAQMLGVCHISSKGIFLGGSPVDAQFGYTCNAYNGHPGSISNIISGSVNSPTVAEVRVSNGIGQCYLDIRVTATGTPLEIALTGLNPGTLLSTPQYQPSVGTNPVTFMFP